MMSPRVGKVIRNPMVKVAAVVEMVSEMITDNHNVKIVQDEEPGEEKPGEPERKRDPCVEVIVVPRRRIVGNNRRAFANVIVFNG